MMPHRRRRGFVVPLGYKEWCWENELKTTADAERPQATASNRYMVLVTGRLVGLMADSLELHLSAPMPERDESEEVVAVSVMLGTPSALKLLGRTTSKIILEQRLKADPLCVPVGQVMKPSGLSSVRTVGHQEADQRHDSDLTLHIKTQMLGKGVQSLHEASHGMVLLPQGGIGFWRGHVGTKALGTEGLHVTCVYAFIVRNEEAALGTSAHRSVTISPVLLSHMA